MSCLVHTILIHGPEIIQHYAILPIGRLAEGAQEARNKDYNRYKLHHASKCFTFYCLPLTLTFRAAAHQV